MAQIAHQSPRSTEQNDLPETNPPLDNQQELTTPAPTASMNNRQDNSEIDPDSEKQFYREHRGWLMIVAILAAGATYQAGLNPPGSFWGSDSENSDPHQHDAGNPILADKFAVRYNIFFYCNGVSFLSSLVIIILLMNKHFHRKRISIQVLKMTMVLDLFCFMAAYAAGSCRSIKTSVIIFVLLGAVFLYVFVFLLCYPELCRHAHSARLRIKSACLVRPRSDIEAPIKRATEADVDNQV